MATAWRLTLICSGLLFLLTAAAPAEVPHTLNFQGRLKDSTGTPYSGSKLVKFSIYDSLGAEIWTTGFNPLSFSEGLVNVSLGAPPHPALPTAALLGDTLLTLGITVDADPEITPRIPLSSTAWSIHAGDADRLDGLEGTHFVQEAGDTMSGSLYVLGNLSVGTDTSISPFTLQAQDHWTWNAGDGWGDFRLGTESLGFNIGIALGGGGAGATRLWSKGGLAEDIYIGSPTSGAQVLVKGVPDEVNLMSKVGINTEDVRSPLTVQSEDKWSWDVDNGNGDFRIGSGDVGFNIGLSLNGLGIGATRFWTEGGLVQQLTFGGPAYGDVMKIDVDSGHVIAFGDVGIGTESIVAPLTVQSNNQWRWDVGSGVGDFRLSNGAAGFSLGVTSVGDVAMWSSGGAREQFMFGGPTRGAVLKIDADLQRTFNWGYSEWQDSLGSPRIQLSPYTDGLRMFGDAYTAVSLFTFGENGGVGLYDSGKTTVNLYSSANGRSGVVRLRRKVPSGLESYGVSMNGGTDSVGGQIIVHDGLGHPRITFDGENDSDLAVMLPQAAINSNEILDEPGIAFNRRTTNLSNLVKSSTSQNFVSVTMTTPADGYIALDGAGYFQCQGDGGAFGWIQISETSARAQEAGHYNWVGPYAFGNTVSGYTYESIPIKRFYFKPKGTYTFYLQGNAYSANSVTSIVDLLAPTWLQATYYPVAYGTASTVAASPDSFESASTVSIADPQTGETSDLYQVDLRDLELKAERARAELERARRELLEAQLNAQGAADAELQRSRAPRPNHDGR